MAGQTRRGDRPRHARPEHARPRARRRGDRRDGVVPRGRSSPGSSIGVVEAVIALQLPRPGRPRSTSCCFLAILVAVYFQSRQGTEETQAFSFTPKRRPIPERLRGVWWVRNLDRGALLLLGARRGRAAAGRHAAVAAPAVHDDPRLRALRPVAHHPHRLGRAALARPDGVRRHRRAARRRVRPRASRSTSAGTDTRVIHGGIEGLGFGPSIVLRRARSPPASPRSSASAPCACAGCSSR